MNDTFHRIPHPKDNKTPATCWIPYNPQMFKNPSNTLQYAIPITATNGYFFIPGTSHSSYGYDIDSSPASTTTSAPLFAQDQQFVARAGDLDSRVSSLTTDTCLSEIDHYYQYQRAATLPSFQACQPQQFVPQIPEALPQQQSFIQPDSAKTIQFPVFSEEYIKREFSQEEDLFFSQLNSTSISSNSSDCDRYQDQNHSHSNIASPDEGDISAAELEISRRNSIAVPMITETSIVVDDRMESALRQGRNKSKKAVSSPFKCHVCKKMIRRDLSRHLRTHQPVSRFRCIFPHRYCRHKSGQFNRPYDYKKHLLNAHFKFDDPNIKKLHNLNEKLSHIGTCSCGLKFTADEWLKDHILTSVDEFRCSYTKHNENEHNASI